MCKLAKVLFLCLIGVIVANAAGVPVSQPKFDLMSAPWTPFKPDGKINFGQIRLDAEFQAKQGVTTIFAVGGMAQWAALTLAERKAVGAEWIKQKHLGLYIIVHVGSQCVEDSIELAKHAEMNGADAIAVIPPFAPQKPPTLDILIEILKKIGSATKLPMIYYHFPGQSGLRWTFTEIMTRALAEVPTFAGVKFVGELKDFAEASQIAPAGFKLFWAPEPKIQAMPYGTTRFVLAESFYAPYLLDMLNAYASGDIPLAEQKQQRLNNLEDLVGRYKGARSVMKMVGIDMGPARLPNAPFIPQHDYDALETALRDWGFFNRTSGPVRKW